MSQPNQRSRYVADAGGPGALQRISAMHKITTNRLKLGNIELVLPELADPVAYLQAHVAAGGDQELPYWTKLWPASLVLAQLAAGSALEGPVLELGAGLGVPGLVAARRGLKVTISDREPDALEFARAAVEINGLEGLVTVRHLDWSQPPQGFTGFKSVLGAEVLYQPKLYPLIADLLDHLLAGDGAAYLSLQRRPFTVGFFDLVASRFDMRGTCRRIRGEDGPTEVFLYRLKRLAAESGLAAAS